MTMAATFSRQNDASSCERTTYYWQNLGKSRTRSRPLLRVENVSVECGGNFRCWRKAETARKKAFRAGHYKDLTEKRNGARKVSGTQDIYPVDLTGK